MADVAVKFGLTSGGAFNGVVPPAYQTGRYYLPHFMVMQRNTLAITANRLYRTWFYIHTTQTFAGAAFRNSGVGDNGKKVRIGIWDASGVLKKDFGETTLDGTAALRSVANSVTLTGPAWYQIGLVSDTGPALYTMEAYGTDAATYTVLSSPAMTFGAFAAVALFGSQNTATANTPIGEYAAFTYGALPDPITAATVTINNSFSASAGTLPAMALYV